MLIIVRHGRTEANAQGLLLGRSDPPLDDTGRTQARSLARSLAWAARAASRVVSSPLTRCRETAEALGLPVVVDDRWIELDYGEWDGRPVAEIPTATWRRWRSDADFHPPGGESLADVGRRVREAANDLVDEATTDDVVVVTHVSPVKASMAWALGVGDELCWRVHVAPAAITRIALGEHGPVLHSFNEASHLR